MISFVKICVVVLRRNRKRESLLTDIKRKVTLTLNKPEITPKVKHRTTVPGANLLTANPNATAIPPVMARSRQLYLFIKIPAKGPVKREFFYFHLFIIKLWFFICTSHNDV